MSQQFHFNRLEADDCHESVAVLDIETGGFEGAVDPLVAIGAGRYDRADGTAESKTFVLDTDVDQVTLIRRAYDWINEFAPDALVTFNGDYFDLPFLADTLDAAAVNGDRPELAYGSHVDLAIPRFEHAGELGEKYPTLEACLAANEVPVHETEWDGAPLSNTRFGEELAPRFITALEEAIETMYEPLHATIRDYATADIEATAALYHADAGWEYTPTYPA